MSRKYRQPGYQSNSNEPRRRPRQDRSVSREGPRSPKMPGLDRVVKCSICGSKLPLTMDEVTYTTECPSCSGDLHSCKNCVYFNPAARFECEQPITARISPKDKRADCEFFQIRSTVEKVTSSSRIDPGNARDAFENLFKK